MKKLIFALTLISSIAFAETKAFKVKIKELTVNGSIATNRRSVTVRPNQIAVISKGIDASGTQTMIELAASDQTPNQIGSKILIRFKIIESIKGVRRVIGESEIITDAGKNADLEATDKSGDHYKIVVAANRVP